MTIQETFAFLGKVRGYDNRIVRLQNTIDALRLNLLPGAIRYDKDRVQTSPQDSTTEIFAKIDEYEREVAELKKKRSDAVLSIDSALSKMKDCNIPFDRRFKNPLDNTCIDGSCKRRTQPRFRLRFRYGG